MAGDAVTEIVLETVVVATANYAYLPFDVPAGVTRIDLALSTSRSAVVGLGLFDGRGHDYQSAGFRGVSGRERREAFVALDDATPGFVPGPIEPGRWTVMVSVFLAVLPTRVSVRVLMTYGAPVAVRMPERLPGVVRDAPGWYRGDLHCHTVHSSDAWATGHALTPAQWADRARALGLDFVALTDHNTISQNWALTSDAGSAVLLLAGQEMTNSFHGHATVTGLQPRDWLDFRQTPLGLPLPTGGRKISEFLTAARDMDAYVSAAHPLSLSNPWQFLVEGWWNAAARPDGLEVWNGPWQRNDELAVRMWHHLLRHGWDVAANGGSDVHSGVDGTHGLGRPTTVVYAASLSRAAIVAGLRAGRSFVTRDPVGVEIYLSAHGADGQETFTGGRIYGAGDSSVRVQALVRGAAGMRLRLLSERGEVASVRIDRDEQVVAAQVPIGATHGFVRAEVRRGDPAPRLGRPSLDMEALSNPIRLVAGRPPVDAAPEAASPPGG